MSPNVLPRDLYCQLQLLAGGIMLHVVDLEIPRATVSRAISSALLLGPDANPRAQPGRPPRGLGGPEPQPARRHIRHATMAGASCLVIYISMIYIRMMMHLARSARGSFGML